MHADLPPHDGSQVVRRVNPRSIGGGGDLERPLALRAGRRGKRGRPEPSPQRGRLASGCQASFSSSREPSRIVLSRSVSGPPDSSSSASSDRRHGSRVGIDIKIEETDIIRQRPRTPGIIVCNFPKAADAPGNSSDGSGCTPHVEADRRPSPPCTALVAGSHFAPDVSGGRRHKRSGAPQQPFRAGPRAPPPRRWTSPHRLPPWRGVRGPAPGTRCQTRQRRVGSRSAPDDASG